MDIDSPGARANAARLNSTLLDPNFMDSKREDERLVELKATLKPSKDATAIGEGGEGAANTEHDSTINEIEIKAQITLRDQFGNQHAINYGGTPDNLAITGEYMTKDGESTEKGDGEPGSGSTVASKWQNMIRSASPVRPATELLLEKLMTNTYQIHIEGQHWMPMVDPEDNDEATVDVNYPSSPVHGGR